MSRRTCHNQTYTHLHLHNAMINLQHPLGMLRHSVKIMTDNGDSAIVVKVMQQLVHVVLKMAVHVGVGLIKDKDVWLRNNGTSQQHTL